MFFGDQGFVSRKVWLLSRVSGRWLLQQCLFCSLCRQANTFVQCVYPSTVACINYILYISCSIPSESQFPSCWPQTIDRSEEIVSVGRAIPTRNKSYKCKLSPSRDTSVFAASADRCSMPTSRIRIGHWHLANEPPIIRLIWAIQCYPIPLSSKLAANVLHDV